MQLVFRINKTSISMNDLVIFFHFEMIGIEASVTIMADFSPEFNAVNTKQKWL